jgi:hypothetical protein
MVMHKEFYIIFETEQKKYLESVGSYFFYFDPDPWFAIKYDDKEKADVVIKNYKLQDICVVRKIKLEFEIQECDSNIE